MDAPGKEIAPPSPRRQAMPGPRSEQEPPQQEVPTNSDGASPAGGGNPAGKGAKRGKGGKTGGGKGKGDTGSQHGGESAHGTPHGTPREGKPLHEIPQDQRCCIKHLWGRCKNGDACVYGEHLSAPTEGIRQHKLYIAMLREHGEPKGENSAASAAGSAGNH